MPNNILGLVPFLQISDIWVNSCFMLCLPVFAQRNLTSTSWVVKSGKKQWWGGEAVRASPSMVSENTPAICISNAPFHSPHRAVLAWMMYVSAALVWSWPSLPCLKYPVSVCIWHIVGTQERLMKWRNAWRHNNNREWNGHFWSGKALASSSGATVITYIVPATHRA